MALITLRQLLDHAAEYGYGVPAFNINNMEQGIAIMEAAKATDAPVIIQASRGARAYAGDTMLRAMIEALAASYPGLPICLHQDHGESVRTCLSAIQNGFTSVMMDGSLEEDGKTPADYAYNVAITRQVADLAHMVGASVEGELGCLGSLVDRRGRPGGRPRRHRHTLARAAADRSGRGGPLRGRHRRRRARGGDRHVARRLQVLRQADGDVLAMDVIETIHARLPNTHIVMHGSSSVPEKWQAVFNENGGAMRETYGVPVDEIVRGIRHGVRKVNIDTDLRLAATAAMRRVAATDAAQFDPRKFLKPAMDAMSEVCRDRFEAFGTAGQASKIRVVPMDDMARRYASGSLGGPALAHAA